MEEPNMRMNLPAMATIAMRVPLLFVLNNLFFNMSNCWKQFIGMFSETEGAPLNVNNTFPLLQLILSFLGVNLAFLVFILPSRILSKAYILIISCGLLQASYWWSEQFLVKLHSNNTVEQWDVMFIERQPETWRHLERTQIVFSRDVFVYVLLQALYASLFALLLRQHISIFLPWAVTFCNFIMFLPVSVAVYCHEPGFEIKFKVVSSFQWFASAVAVSVLIIWIWSLTVVSDTLHFNEFFQKLRTIRNDLGLQMLLEHEWKRLHVPTLLRVFWISNALWLALGHYFSIEHLNNDINAYWNWTTLRGVASEFAIAGCGSFIMLLGMSAVVAKIANHIGCLIHMIIKSTDDEEKYIGTVSAVLFFILALQTGLTELEGHARLVRLFRNSCLLVTAILHFIHNMLNQVMLSLGASQNTSWKRHARVLFVALLLLVIPFLLFYSLWTSYEMSTWILAVSAFCLELCIKVLVTTSVYTLFMIDTCCNTYWENLDDYVYYLKGAGSIIEFLFGVFLFFNGGWILLFESGGIIRAFMMSIHAYFNIFVQAKEGWKMFQNRRTAVTKINNLPFATASQLTDHDDVCAICYHELLTARITPCGHMFHGMCLRKWLYLQDVCPMCQKKLVDKIETDKKKEEPIAEEPHNVNDAEAAAEQSTTRENTDSTSSGPSNSTQATLDHNDLDSINSLIQSNIRRRRRRAKASNDVIIVHQSEMTNNTNYQLGYIDDSDFSDSDSSLSSVLDNCDK
ncbi:E3 ubiquitin-protein ligase RNF139-like [Antedon mediterranea]|uniref:E3 ubiquitin-protein ligase RNF139-like n=1 Tax=Antedon mediterranea TaxID=105859 RepID=UPI003AF82CCD